MEEKLYCEMDLTGIFKTQYKIWSPSTIKSDFSDLQYVLTINFYQTRIHLPGTTYKRKSDNYLCFYLALPCGPNHIYIYWIQNRETQVLYRQNTHTTMEYLYLWTPSSYSHHSLFFVSVKETNTLSITIGTEKS
jgi:hypothetical protein